jgi:hypothetical protein
MYILVGLLNTLPLIVETKHPTAMFYTCIYKCYTVWGAIYQKQPQLLQQQPFSALMFY